MKVGKFKSYKVEMATLQLSNFLTFQPVPTDSNETDRIPNDRRVILLAFHMVEDLVTMTPIGNPVHFLDRRGD